MAHAGSGAVAGERGRSRDPGRDGVASKRSSLAAAHRQHASRLGPCGCAAPAFYFVTCVHARPGRLARWRSRCSGLTPELRPASAFSRLKRLTGSLREKFGQM
eukprot:1304894-Prymnesium_polylepis.2